MLFCVKISKMSVETNTKTKERWQLNTGIPGLVLSELSAEDLSDIKNLFDKNYSHFAKGGMILGFERLDDEAKNGSPEGVRRLAIRLNNVLVGYAGVIQEDMNVNEVEISYANDVDHTRMGIALATVNALTDYEIEQGNDVVAEVEEYNHASMRLLEGAGFSKEKRRRHGRTVFKAMSYNTDNLLRHLNNL